MDSAQRTRERLLPRRSPWTLPLFRQAAEGAVREQGEWGQGRPIRFCFTRVFFDRGPQLLGQNTLGVARSTAVTNTNQTEHRTTDYKPRELHDLVLVAVRESGAGGSARQPLA